MSKPIAIAMWMMAALAVFPTATLHAQPEDGFVTVSGSAAYRERIAMPPDAVLTVRIEDVSRAELLALHGGHTRQGRCQHRHESSGLPLREVRIGRQSVEEATFSQRGD